MKHNIVEATHRTENAVRKYYTWRASNYDAGASFEVEHHAEAVRLAGIQESQQVLDVACGTGRGTIGLAEAVGSSGKVEALDLTEAMLEKARVKIESLGLSDRVHFQQGNTKELPYADASFDVLYNGYMFDLIPINDFLRILKEFYRVLRTNGKLMLVNMSKPGTRKTFYERVYGRGLAVMPCRPVLMSPFVQGAGFGDIHRLYRPSHGFLISRLWGTEIVSARKASV